MVRYSVEKQESRVDAPILDFRFQECRFWKKKNNRSVLERKTPRSLYRRTGRSFCARSLASIRFRSIEYLFHLVHDTIHLHHREVERFRSRHIDTGGFQKLDRKIGSSRGEEPEKLRRRGLVAGECLLRQRCRRGERRRILIDVVVVVEMGDERHSAFISSSTTHTPWSCP